MSAPLLIRGGRILDPTTRRDETGDLFLSGGAVRDSLSETELAEARVIEAAGKVVSPGFIDLRTHLREPGGGGRETIASGTRAAAAGGFTTLVCMPDVSPPADNPGTIRYIQDAIAKNAIVNVLPAGCMTMGSEGENLAPIGSLAQAGVAAVTDCPASPANNEIFKRTLQYAAMFGLPLFDLPRDPTLTADAAAHEGATALRLGLRGWPRSAEELYVYRAVALASEVGARTHLQSISSAGSVEILRRAKQRGVPVTADVTPHHLALTDASLAGYDPHFKTNPPLREESDRRALLAGLLDGALDCVATSHEPCLDHEKDVEFDLAPFGVIGLETALPVTLDALVRNGPGELLDAVAVLSSRPAAVLGLNKGSLKPGSPADVTVFDPEETWTVSEESLESLSANSPWLGEELRGRASHVVVAGEIVREPAPVS